MIHKKDVNWVVIGKAISQVQRCH